MGKRVHQLSLDAVNDPGRRRAAVKSPHHRPQILVTKISGKLEEQEPWVVDDDQLALVADGEELSRPDPKLVEFDLSERVEIEVRDRKTGETFFLVDAVVAISFAEKRVEGTTLIVKTQTLKIDG